MLKLKDVINEKLKMGKSSSFKTKVKNRLELEEIINNRISNDHESLYVGDLDISNIDSLNNLFNKLQVKEITGLEEWDVSNVVNMSYLFSQCPNLKEISDISNWNLSNCKTIIGLFYMSPKIESIDLSAWEETMDPKIYQRNAFYGARNFKNKPSWYKQ